MLSLLLLAWLTFCNQVLLLPRKSDRPQGQISPAEILEKHIVATGGLKGLQTLHAHGDFGLPGINRSGDFHFHYKAPASDVFQLDATSHGQSAIGRYEGKPFLKLVAQGFGRVNGVTLAVWEETWLALIEASFDPQHYARIELAGLTEIDGKWAYALRFTPLKGDPQVRYFDCDTFLMVRMDLVQRIREKKDGPESAYKVETHYSGYRDFGGINLPRKIRTSASSVDVEMRIQDVSTNGPLDDSVFQKK